MISDLQEQVKSLNHLLNSGDDAFEATKRMREYDWVAVQSYRERDDRRLCQTGLNLSW
jgi:hypothetical protein